MLSVAKDILEYSILPRTYTFTRTGLLLFCMSSVPVSFLPKKRHSSVFQLILLSSSVLNISLISAIIGPKFPFYKDVTTTCKNGVSPYL